jgi:hypothetical protein
LAGSNPAKNVIYSAKSHIISELRVYTCDSINTGQIFPNVTGYMSSQTEADQVNLIWLQIRQLHQLLEKSARQLSRQGLKYRF